MAAYTSTQTGLWNDSATWGGGGYPSTDDTATINHEVVYNLTSSSSPFYGDVTINYSNGDGHLRHLEDTHMNMNGVLTVNGGIYEMVDGTTLAFTGNNDQDHGLLIDSDDHTTFLATGTTPVAETRFSTSGDAGDMYLPVEDASDFASGDWISVFFRYGDLKSREDFLNETGYPSGVLQGDGVMNTGQYAGSALPSSSRFHNECSHATDEGFIVHDVSSNNIYVRDLIGPEATITKVASNKITVDNAKVFRETQAIIFGNGSTRTTSTITSINYNNNKITLADTLSDSNVVGEKVYLTALKKHQYKRTIVRRMGSMVPTETASGATTITLSSVGDYSVGDEFFVEHTVEEGSDWATIIPNDASTWYQDVQVRHKVTGISGNTLTFTPALPYKVYANSFAYKITRPINIKGASDDPTDGTCKPYILAINNTSTRVIAGQTRYRRKMLVKDLGCFGLGNSSSTYQWYVRGGFNDGYWRYSSGFEGLVLDAAGNNHGYYVRHDLDYYRSYRCHIVANWYRGSYSGREGFGIYNAAILNCRRGFENTTSGQFGSYLGFIRNTRSYDYYRAYHRSNGQNISQYQIFVQNEAGLRQDVRQMVVQCELYTRYYGYYYGGQQSDFYYGKIKQITSDNTQSIRQFAYNPNNRIGNYDAQGYASLFRDLDYEIDNDLYFCGGLLRYDKEEGAFEMTHCYGADYRYPQGYFEELYLEPNETVTIKAEAKIHPNNPNSNWQYRPYLVYSLSAFNIRTDQQDYTGVIHQNITGGTDLDKDFDFVGDLNKLDKNTKYPLLNYGNDGNFNYDSSSHPDHFGSRDQIDSKTVYKAQSITVTNPFPFKSKLTYGLGAVSSNAAYGWYMKPYIVARSHGGNMISKLHDRIRSFLPTFRRKGSVAEKQKKRIGGARL